jgi:cytochrome c-type biogenesis protein CcmH/NrfG
MEKDMEIQRHEEREVSKQSKQGEMYLRRPRTTALSSSKKKGEAVFMVVVVVVVVVAVVVVWEVCGWDRKG